MWLSLRLAFGAFGLMGLPIGLLADAFGERGVLVLMGGCVCVSVGAFGVLLSREAGTLPLPTLAESD